MKLKSLKSVACIAAAALFSASTVFGQMGHRWPSEKKIVPDPVTGVPLEFLTSASLGDAKIYQTHQQWTVDGKWLIYRGSDAQAYAVNEQSGDIVQVTESGYTGMLCNMHKSMDLVIMHGGRGSPQQIIDIDLGKLLPDAMAGTVKPAAEYEHVCGTLPAELRSGGNMGLDANDDYAYFNVTGPDTEKLNEGQTLQGNYGPRIPPLGAGPSGLRSMNLKTGEIKFICNVGFQIGHVQTNPLTPGEIIFCWETGGKAPQRTWFVKSDGSGLRPLWPEAPYDWVTHEAAFDADEVAIAILAHRKPGADGGWGPASTGEYPSGVGIVNLRTREMRIVGQVPIGNPGKSIWHVAGSQDGRWAAADDFQYRLWLIDRKNSEMVLLADLGHVTDAQDHIHPTFSLDSTRIEVETAMLHAGQNQAPTKQPMNICVVPIPKAFLNRTYSEKLPE